ncbi:MAG TPA: hypothetical protein VFB16_06680 [Bauldia sp.]|nr:hypothetical protein [Bauldia sp.]
MTAIRPGLAALSVLAALVLTVPPAAAEPVTANDAGGQTYRLEDNGSYSLVVTGNDGKTYLLAPNGRWRPADAAAGDPALDKSLADKISAWVDDEEKDMAEDRRSAVKACMIAAVADLSPEAKQGLLAGADFERTARDFISRRPDLTPGLSDKFEACF